VERPVFICLEESAYHVIVIGGHRFCDTSSEDCHYNDGYFVDVILLYKFFIHINSCSFDYGVYED
jgi:hypothetical protein